MAILSIIQIIQYKIDFVTAQDDYSKLENYDKLKITKAVLT